MELADNPFEFDDELVELSYGQLHFLRRLVRMELRKHQRGNRALRAKFGEEFSPAERNARQAEIEATYRALGGDPKRINNLLETENHGTRNQQQRTSED